MSSINLSTALSGISAANERLRASSSASPSRSAPLKTSADAAAIKEAAAAQRNPPVEQAPVVVEQQSATYAFVANLRVLQTQLRGEGVMLDVHA